MNRSLWKQRITLTRPPVWHCSKCNTGRLTVQKETLSEGETAESIQLYQHEAWEPSWIEGRFSCLLKSQDCAEITVMAGKYSVVEYWDGEEPEIECVKYYAPQFIMEAPHIIHLPKALPSEIIDEMRKSFQLYWVDLPSCANRLRVSVEFLLTHMKVKRTTVNKKGKRQVVCLHERISILESTHKALAQSLYAIKWIGNAGSHSTSLTVEDILDAYEIIEHVFEELFEMKAKKVAKLSKQINKRRKPRFTTH